MRALALLERKQTVNRVLYISSKVRNIFKIFSSSQTAILSSDWMAVTFFAILWSSLN